MRLARRHKQKPSLILFTTCIGLAKIQCASSFLATSSHCVAKSSLSPPPNALHASPPSSSSAQQQLRIPPGALGPPEPLKSLQVGQSANAFRSLQNTAESADQGTHTQNPSSSQTHQFTIQRVSHSPEIFHLHNFLTPQECIQIMSMAKQSGMEQAQTVTEHDSTSRKNCRVAWLPSSNSSPYELVGNLVSGTIHGFLSAPVHAHSSSAVEDLQVLCYGAGGEFVPHHDGEARILTVIYYLNGVGGTWFPLARGKEERHPEEDTNGWDHRMPVNKGQALEMIRDLVPGKDGLLVRGMDDTSSKEEPKDRIVSITQGDAIAFYNYLDDGSARFDWTAIHCGLPTTEEEGGGEKWIANHWYRLNVLEET
ncbi:hypothetical protein HJC23_012222 [Cyclotella cryptica]|uniref:Fe2OG dioxygenase domain-containing protein n=1 Tax=Cyclotella cryptica TaxID=29204 RepID=A0ABD3P5L2_9STRA